MARFAPSLPLARHPSTPRARVPSAFTRQPGLVVLTSYDVLRRDASLLSSVDWATVVLDEAQNIHPPTSITARAARSLSASLRFALTGLPLESRLAELWSLLEFANPGLLGPQEAFRQHHVLPMERFGHPEATERLRRLAGPFLLRRLKSDPAILQELAEPDATPDAGVEDDGGRHTHGKEGLV